MSKVLRIVVADDERDTREYLLELLQRLGHQVVATDNGRHLVELARAGQPDLLITDIRMPDMDGIEAAVMVNRERVTPVILISGHHEAALLQRAVDGPVMAYLIKPVNQHDVEATIAVAMARFEEYRQARQEAQDLKQALEERKVIERAKGSVMRRLAVDEQEAFRRLKKMSSDQNRKLTDVARAVLGAEEVFQQMDRV